MNYIKIISHSAGDTFFEDACNRFLREVSEKKHRVMGSRFHLDDKKWWYAVFTINDEPHPLVARTADKKAQ